MSATTDTTPKTKGGWWALSPLAVFLCLYLVTSLLVNDFYKVPITVAFLSLIHILTTVSKQSAG